MACPKRFNSSVQAKMLMRVDVILDSFLKKSKFYTQKDVF